MDVGIGDVIVPNAKTRTIRTQLEGFKALEIMTYSLVSVIV